MCFERDSALRVLGCVFMKWKTIYTNHPGRKNVKGAARPKRRVDAWAKKGWRSRHRLLTVCLHDLSLDEWILSFVLKITSFASSPQPREGRRGIKPSETDTRPHLWWVHQSIYFRRQLYLVGIQWEFLCTDLVSIIWNCLGSDSNIFRITRRPYHSNLVRRVHWGWRRCVRGIYTRKESFEGDKDWVYHWQIHRSRKILAADCPMTAF